MSVGIELRIRLGDKGLFLPVSSLVKSSWEQCFCGGIEQRAFVTYPLNFLCSPRRLSNFLPQPAEQLQYRPALLVFGSLKPWRVKADGMNRGRNESCRKCLEM